jgi:hypothetical protein
LYVVGRRARPAACSYCLLFILVTKHTVKVGSQEVSLAAADRQPPHSKPADKTGGAAPEEARTTNGLDGRLGHSLGKLNTPNPNWILTLTTAANHQPTLVIIQYKWTNNVTRQSLTATTDYVSSFYASHVTN